MKIFGKYSDFYDALYKDKDYQKECTIIKNTFEKYCDKPVKTILDLGCGTGNHDFILNDWGYKITGVDRSDAMLSIAQKKKAKLKNKTGIHFIKNDIKKLKLREKFDAVIMMFGVLSYQLADTDVEAALSTAKNHLKDNGLFLFDAWYGPAVLHNGPSQRMKKVKTEDGEIIRYAITDMNSQIKICTVHYKTVNTQNRKAVNTIMEDHSMRFFFPEEIELFLKNSGFKNLYKTSFPDLKNPSENSWNVFWVSKAI